MSAERSATVVGKVTSTYLRTRKDSQVPACARNYSYLILSRVPPSPRSISPNAIGLISHLSSLNIMPYAQLSWRPESVVAYYEMIRDISYRF